MTAVVESDLEDLAVQRYLLDLALQPLDAWDGFTKIEQYAGSALRYQLNYLCYALAMAQFTRTPAFTGYLGRAQRNTIEKMRDKRVWGYWAHESLIGYGRWQTDPMKHANIMYTGFYAAMLGMYETMNADDRFARPGALTLRVNARKEHVYDYPRVCDRIVENMRRSKWTQYPCEPHLVYPMCNAHALNGLTMHDRLRGTDLAPELVAKVEDSYHRFGFLRADGRFLFGRGPLGFRFPPTVGNEGVMAFWLHSLMPKQAQASWELLRERCLEFGESEIDVKPHLVERLDAGNYRRTDAWSRAMVMVAAAEHGDVEVVRGVEASLDNRAEIIRSNGARRYRKASTWTNAIFGLARFTRENALDDLVHGRLPEQWRTGPVLAEAAYPDVLVARAVTDGAGLELVLRPGAGAVRATLGLRRLTPGRVYSVSGAATDRVTADHDGAALVDVDLADRTEITVRPA
jgi:hypothetical protein